MTMFKPTDDQLLDEYVLDQALMWMVTLQSGVSGAAEQHACAAWRNANPQHELAWQRLTGLMVRMICALGLSPGLAALSVRGWISKAF